MFVRQVLEMIRNLSRITDSNELLTRKIHYFILRKIFPYYTVLSIPSRQSGDQGHPLDTYRIVLILIL